MKFKRNLAFFVSVVILIGCAAVLRSLPAISQPAPIVLERMGQFCADDPKCFNRLHPAILATATVAPSQSIVFGTRDAFDGACSLRKTTAYPELPNLGM